MSNESGHWYFRDGTPCHTLPTKSPGAKSPTRNTTVADARKLKLLPSVSGIVRMMSSPGLERYKIGRAVEECYNRPPVGAETLREYQGYILEKAGQPARDASNFGTIIHAAIEAALSGEDWTGPETITYPSTGKQMAVKAVIEPVLGLLMDRGVHVIATERVLTCQDGFAGTTDALTEGPVDILDFKTKTTKPGEPIECPPTYAMQLAAYHACAMDMDGDIQTTGIVTFDHPAANIFISSTEPGRVEWHEHSRDELIAAWGSFKHCLGLWKWANNYDPSFIRT